MPAHSSSKAAGDVFICLHPLSSDHVGQQIHLPKYVSCRSIFTQYANPAIAAALHRFGTLTRAVLRRQDLQAGTMGWPASVNWTISKDEGPAASSKLRDLRRMSAAKDSS